MKSPGISFTFGVIITLLVATLASACPLTGDCYSPVVAPPVVVQQAVAPPVVVQSYAAPAIAVQSYAAPVLAVRSVAVPTYGVQSFALRQNLAFRQGFSGYGGAAFSAGFSSGFVGRQRVVIRQRSSVGSLRANIRIRR